MSESEAGLERECTAYHEAGHAVMAWTFGLEFERVSIVPTEEWSGVVSVNTEGLSEFDEEVLGALALTTLAGEVAAEIHTGTPIDWGKWLGQMGTDVEGYKDLALRLGWYEMDGNVTDLQPPMVDREAEVRSLMVERWAAVEALAAALLQDGEISGTGALSIVSEAGVPDPVASVWPDLLEERKAEAEMRARFEAARSRTGGSGMADEAGGWKEAVEAAIRHDARPVVPLRTIYDAVVGSSLVTPYHLEPWRPGKQPRYQCAIRRTLTTLVVEGRVERVGHGKYSLPARSDA